MHQVAKTDRAGWGRARAARPRGTLMRISRSGVSPSWLLSVSARKRSLSSASLALDISSRRKMSCARGARRGRRARRRQPSVRRCHHHVPPHNTAACAPQARQLAAERSRLAGPHSTATPAGRSRPPAVCELVGAGPGGSGTAWSGAGAPRTLLEYSEWMMMSISRVTSAWKENFWAPLRGSGACAFAPRGALRDRQRASRGAMERRLQWRRHCGAAAYRQAVKR